MLRLHVSPVLRLCVFTLLAGTFFGFAHGACQLNAQGYGIAGVGTPPTTCAGGTNNTPSRFNNNQSYGALTTFLRAYGFTFDKIDCTNAGQVGNAVSNVQTIQNVLNDLSAILGKDCGTCVDGKFGLHTKSKIALCTPNCVGGNKPVNATDPKCDSGYIHDGSIGCCKPNCVDGEKMPQNANGGCDDPNFKPENGCCIPNCQGEKKPVLAQSDCSDQPGYKYENGCCVPLTPSNNNVTERESGCNLAPGTLNNSTVSCIEKKGNNPCCIDSGCWNQLAPGQTKPNLEFCPTPNPCTGTGQIGVQSGTSRTCKPCPDPTKQKPNPDHTKCICDSSKGCCGIQLNTVVPFIGDCIEMSNEESSNNTTRVTALNAFPKLMGGLSKIIVTAILIFSFVMVVAGGVLITAGGLKQENYKTGIDIITKVIVALALLGASGIILRLINPNFFG